MALDLMSTSSVFINLLFFNLHCRLVGYNTMALQLTYVGVFVVHSIVGSTKRAIFKFIYIRAERTLIKIEDFSTILLALNTKNAS